MNYCVKIGIVPIRRNVAKDRTGIFSPKYALKNKEESVKYIKENYQSENVEFIDLDFLNDEGLLYDEKDAAAVAEKFINEKVDGLFIINCNFGNEEAAGMLSRAMKKPVLIWAPKDEIFETDGTRYTDSQCGLFALSKYLQRNKIPFSHIKNCNIKDSDFEKGLRQFLSVTCMVKNFKGLRVAQVGARPKPFCSVIVNESELVTNFGIDIVPVNLAVFLEKHNAVMENKDINLDKEAEEFMSRYENSNKSKEYFKKVMAIKHVYREILAEYDCDVISTECWTAMEKLVGAMPCCAMSELADEKIIVTCESDIHGSITMALLSAASFGQSIPFFIEFTVKHPDNDNADLLWHCGPVAYSLKKPGINAKCDNGRCAFELKNSNYTIARLDMMDGKYMLYADKFKSTDGPYTFGNYIWGEFENFDKVEKKIINGPYIHHMAEIEGDYVEALEEFCKFIPEINIDLVK